MATCRGVPPALLLLIAPCALAAVQRQGDRLTITTSALTLNLDLRHGTLSGRLAARGRTAELRDGALLILDGKQKRQFLCARLRDVSVGPDRAAFSCDPAPGLKVRCTLTEVQSAVLWSVELRNDSPEQMWLEPMLTCSLPRSAGTRLWDGFQDSLAPSEDKRADSLRGKFPLAALYTPDLGVAVGFEPLQWLSYLATTYSPLDHERARLAQSARVVVDPGRPERVGFLLFGFRGDYGFRRALDAYYRLFPAVFRPRPDVDQRINLSGATYLAYTSRPQPELCRRLYAGWEWCYAPFRRTGDILGHPEYWDYQPARPMSRGRAVPRDQYLAARRKRFDNGLLCNVAMLFYIPSGIWCEERLAKEHFSDALTTDPKVTTVFTRPWVTGHDNEVRVYPWGNSYGDFLVANMAQVADQLNLQGFAFDTAEGGAKYRGPGINRSPGRAWDERGVYCDEGIAVGKLMDYVHSLQPHGHTLAVVSNPTYVPTFHPPFRSDATMIEGIPWRGLSNYPDQMRYFIGHKSCVWWEDYLLEKIVNYQRLTPAEIEDAYRGLADYTILASLYWGVMPTPRLALGTKRIVEALPLIVEVTQAGWQPVPAARADDRLWVSRFGEGLGCRWTVGNTSADRIAGDLVVHTADLGTPGLCVVRSSGVETKSRLSAHTSAVPLDLPSRGWAVYRARLSIDPPPVGGTAALQERRTADAFELLVTTQVTGRHGATLTARLPDGYRFDTCLAAGKAVAAKLEGRNVAWHADLSGTQHWTLTARSPHFITPEKELLGFPILSQGKSSFRLATPTNPPPEIEDAAQRVRWFVAGLTGRPFENGGDHYLVLTTNHVKSEFGPKLDGAAQPGEHGYVVGLCAQGQTLYVNGSNPAAVREGTLALLRVLDKRHPNYGRFPRSAAADKAGLTGRVLR